MKMINGLLPILLVASVLLFAGCTQKEAGTVTTTTRGDQETGDTSVDPADLPVLDEDDSVEIGDMIEEEEALEPADLPILEQDDSVDIGEMIE